MTALPRHLTVLGRNPLTAGRLVINTHPNGT